MHHLFLFSGWPMKSGKIVVLLHTIFYGLLAYFTSLQRYSTKMRLSGVYI
jgi:hypothetical protein